MSSRIYENKENRLRQRSHLRGVLATKDTQMILTRRSLGATMGIALAFLGSVPARAEIHRIDVTLFMPCDNETAARAAESLESIPGVTNVDLVAGKLEVSVETDANFTRDPLELVQMLWDGRIYPNKIYLQATGRFEKVEHGYVFRAEGTGQSFQVLDDPAIEELVQKSAAGPPLFVRGEVVDWIEDRIPEDGRLYTLRVFEEPGA